MLKRNLFVLLKILISILIIAIIIKSLNINRFKAILNSMDFNYFFIAAGILPLAILIRSYRWLYLMNYEGKLVNFKVAIHITLAGLALNTLMPAQTGEIAKSYFGYRWTGIKERMLSISLYDKIIAISSIAFLGIFAGIAKGNSFFSLVSLFAFFPFVMIYIMRKNRKVYIFIFKLVNRIIKRNIDFEKLIKSFIFDRPMLVKAFLLSILGWVLGFSILWLSFKMTDAQPSLLYVYMASPILTLGRLIPFTLNGIGSDEAIIIGLFNSIGISADQSFSAALIYRLLLLIIPGIAGLLIILSKKENKHE